MDEVTPRGPGTPAATLIAEGVGRLPGVVAVSLEFLRVLWKAEGRARTRGGRKDRSDGGTTCEATKGEVEHDR